MLDYASTLATTRPQELLAALGRHPLKPAEVVANAILLFRRHLPELPITLTNLVLALRPELMTSFHRHFSAVMDGGTVDVRLKELVAVRVSHLNGSDY